MEAEIAGAIAASPSIDGGGSSEAPQLQLQPVVVVAPARSTSRNAAQNIHQAPLVTGLFVNKRIRHIKMLETESDGSVLLLGDRSQSETNRTPLEIADRMWTPTSSPLAHYCMNWWDVDDTLSGDDQCATSELDASGAVPLKGIADMLPIPTIIVVDYDTEAGRAVAEAALCEAAALSLSKQSAPEGFYLVRENLKSDVSVPPRGNSLVFAERIAAISAEKLASSEHARQSLTGVVAITSPAETTPDVSAPSLQTQRIDHPQYISMQQNRLANDPTPQGPQPGGLFHRINGIMNSPRRSEEIDSMDATRSAGPNWFGKINNGKKERRSLIGGGGISDDFGVGKKTVLDTILGGGKKARLQQQYPQQSIQQQWPLGQQPLIPPGTMQYQQQSQLPSGLVQVEQPASVGQNTVFFSQQPPPQHQALANHQYAPESSGAQSSSSFRGEGSIRPPLSMQHTPGRENSFAEGPISPPQSSPPFFPDVIPTDSVGSPRRPKPLPRIPVDTPPASPLDSPLQKSFQEDSLLVASSPLGVRAHDNNTVANAEGQQQSELGSNASEPFSGASPIALPIYSSGATPEPSELVPTNVDAEMEEQVQMQQQSYSQTASSGPQNSDLGQLVISPPFSQPIATVINPPTAPTSTFIMSSNSETYGPPMISPVLMQPRGPPLSQLQRGDISFPTSSSQPLSQQQSMVAHQFTNPSILQQRPPMLHQQIVPKKPILQPQRQAPTLQQFFQHPMPLPPPVQSQNHSPPKKTPFFLPKQQKQQKQKAQQFASQQPQPQQQQMQVMRPPAQPIVPRNPNEPRPLQPGQLSIGPIDLYGVAKGFYSSQMQFTPIDHYGMMNGYYSQDNRPHWMAAENSKVNEVEENTEVGAVVRRAMSKKATASIPSSSNSASPLAAAGGKGGIGLGDVAAQLSENAVLPILVEIDGPDAELIKRKVTDRLVRKNTARAIADARARGIFEGDDEDESYYEDLKSPIIDGFGGVENLEELIYEDDANGPLDIGRADRRGVIVNLHSRIVSMLGGGSFTLSPISKLAAHSAAIAMSIANASPPPTTELLPPKRIRVPPTVTVAAMRNVQIQNSLETSMEGYSAQIGVSSP